MRLFHWLHALLAQTAPNKMFVVIGQPNQVYTEPKYTTDPRVYGLPLFNRELSDQEFDEHYRKSVRAFLNSEDAIDFAYHCNLDSVQLPVYVKCPEGWVHSDAETKQLVDSIDW